jgi:hypothetical protein
MATCRFPGCDTQDPSSVFPPRWILVVAEIRGPRTAFVDIKRRKWLLCPTHAPLVLDLCPPESGSDGGPDDGVVVDPRRYVS